MFYYCGCFLPVTSCYLFTACFISVNPDEYKVEKQNLKECIRKAKRLIPDRKELVMRVKLVEDSLRNKDYLPFCPNKCLLVSYKENDFDSLTNHSFLFWIALIADARETVLKMRQEAPLAEIHLRGMDVDDLINELEESREIIQLKLKENAMKKQAEVTSKTRSGRVLPTSKWSMAGSHGCL